ncbi:MAG: antitoxin CptB [Lysobacterales bacterium]|jgi:antitoxin CptB
MQGEDRFRKLRWLCRRGMKELDVLLESFLEQHQQELKSGGLAHFESFLDQEDDLIWYWLQKQKTPENEQFQILVNLIRRDS